MPNRAQRALDCVQGRPHDALAWSSALLSDPTATPLEQASASWALGRAHSELDQLDQAREAFTAGLARATAHQLTEIEGEIRVSLATCLLLAGDTAEAHRQLDLADPHLRHDASRGRLHMQRGFLAMHQGALSDARAHFDRAEQALESSDDDVVRTRLLLNRGVTSTMLGDIARGEADFLAARDLADRLGQPLMGAGATQNLGFVAGRRGDYPAALRWFSEARTHYATVGSPQRLLVTLELDSCTVLLSAGLHAEAAAAAERAVAAAERTGNRLSEAEARLLLARARIAGGDAEQGELEAAAAARTFRDTTRPAWAAHAEYVALQAAARRLVPSSPLYRRAVLIADDLAANGWQREALEVRTFAGRTALDLGLVEEARAQLAPLAEVGDDDSSALRATALLATATLRLADGDRPGAKVALSAGMAVLEEHRSSFGSTELRAHASINAAELAELGLELATDDGDPLEVLAWAERWHAGGLQVSPVRAEPDSPLARALNELREVHGAVMAGTADPFDDVDHDHRIATLERTIRDLSRSAPGPAAAVAAAVPPGPAAPTTLAAAGPDPRQLRQALGSHVLVEYYTIGGALHAVVASADEVTVHSLGAMDELEADIRRLGATIARLAYGRAQPRALDAARAALEATAHHLDERLVAKLNLPPRADVVLVPTGPLQGLPWPVLPSLSQRAVTVTPSACLWARTCSGGRPGPAGTTPDGATPPGAGPGRTTDRRSEPGSEPGTGPGSLAGIGRQPGSVLLVCGPDLPGGEREIELLASLYRDPIVLTGADATVSRVTEAMARADLVHLAVHGTFRADNPMFSSLGLHDGPLTVYDLEALTPAPATVVLSACDAARTSVGQGDELLGTAAALLQVGVRAVIAPVTVVPDATVVPQLMVALHRQLGAGLAPAAALAAARCGLARHADQGAGAVLSSFVVIGCGSA